MTRAMVVMLAGLAASAGPVAPARADPRLAGELRVADTHGQPFCQTPVQLQRYLAATIAHAPVPPDALRGCVLVPYATRVFVVQDLAPFGSRLHVLRATAATPLQKLIGYTYSVGLYDARRFAPYSPYGDAFPLIP